MAADAQGLVHGGFYFGMADYAVRVPCDIDLCCHAQRLGWIR